MVIELSGVQFGLKSYALFQNGKSMQGKFELQNKLHSTQFIYHCKLLDYLLLILIFDLSCPLANYDAIEISSS